MTDQPSSLSHVVHFNPSLHEQPWVALNDVLRTRGAAVFVVIDGAIDGARGRVTPLSANAEARASVVDQLRDPSLLSLLVLRGPSVHGDEALALALACDIRWAAPGATIESTALDAELLPYAGVIHAAVARLGQSKAMALAVRGIPLTAAQAVDWDVIDEVVADHDLDRRIDALVVATGAMPRELIAEAKALLTSGSRDAARRREGEAIDRLQQAP
jgi:Enoyl-CoA hydratase/isomerase